MMREWPYTALSRDVLYTYTAERRGVLYTYTARFEAVYGHSLIINPSLGMYQKIHPHRAMSIDNVKINTSLLMRREWVVPSNLKISLSPQEISPAIVVSSPLPHYKLSNSALTSRNSFGDQSKRLSTQIKFWAKDDFQNKHQSLKICTKIFKMWTNLSGYPTFNI